MFSGIERLSEVGGRVSKGKKKIKAGRFVISSVGCRTSRVYKI